MKIGLVSSPGGHLYKTIQLKEWWIQHDYFWVLDASKKDQISKNILQDSENIYSGFFPENRNIFNAIRNFFLALKILYKEKPDVIFSMGAGIAPPFFLAAKLLRLVNIEIKSVFIETFILIPKPTLSGKIIYHLKLSNLFIIQNKKMSSSYPDAIYIGSIL